MAGFGRRLLTHVMTDNRVQRPGLTVGLSTQSENNVAFYKKAGFSVTSTGFSAGTYVTEIHDAL